MLSECFVSKVTMEKAFLDCYIEFRALYQSSRRSRVRLAKERNRSMCEARRTQSLCVENVAKLLGLLSAPPSSRQLLLPVVVLVAIAVAAAGQITREANCVQMLFCFHFSFLRSWHLVSKASYLIKLVKLGIIRPEAWQLAPSS